MAHQKGADHFCAIRSYVSTMKQARLQRAGGSAEGYSSNILGYPRGAEDVTMQRVLTFPLHPPHKVSLCHGCHE